MKHISILATLLIGTLVLTTSCNDEWEDEQYAHYVSFSAPLDNNGVREINVPFTRCLYDENGDLISNKYESDGNGGVGMSDYDLPVIISGSTTNSRNVTVHFSADPDTLATMNYARFQNRHDLYYHDMSNYASYPSELTIPSGTDVSLLNIKFDFNGIDMVNKWVLPIQILDDSSYDYESHPRQYYSKALLRVYPFNDWSGLYSGTAQQISIAGDTDASAVESVRLYVVDENTVFLYPGLIDEDRVDRANYKIYLTFVPTDETHGTVHMTCDNPDVKFAIDKVDEDDPESAEEVTRYTVIEEMDAVQDYVKHRYVIISNISYQFSDYTQIPGYEMRYSVGGSLTGERIINTEIERTDPQHAIDWD